MRFADRQKRVEEHVYETIEEIADEFDLEIPFYPEVYYVGRNFDFNSVGVDSFRLELTSSEDDEKEEEEESFHGLASAGVCLVRPSIILIKDTDRITISEEAAHFLHFSRSRLLHQKFGKNDTLCLRIFAETLGYLGSKVACPERCNTFNLGPDLYYSSEQEFSRYFDLLTKKLKSPVASSEYYIYQQARGLGERMFEKYSSGKITKGHIRRLFEEDFDLIPSHVVASMKIDHWRKGDKRKFDAMIHEVVK
ncbi:Uncharacterised protein [uncultured archaeon]|nr:Uncharacterised protein [uncultured archaeon]